MNAHTVLRTLITLIVLCVTNLPAQTPFDNWELTLYGQSASMTDSLARFGIRPDGTPDYDNAYDIPRPPRAPSGMYLEIYFPHSGSNYPPLLGSKYAADIQGSSDPTWNLSVEASTPGIVVLTWDSASVSAIAERVQLFLLDPTSGTEVNMRTHGHYSFSYSTKRDLRIVGAIKVDLTYLMEGFWNGATQIQDTVRGYLALASSPYTLVDSIPVTLSAAGSGLLVFMSAPSGTYNLVVRHRNHLEVWSSSALALSSGTTSIPTPYDFSAGAGSAYGSGALKQEGAVFVGWGGDVNQDGVIDYRDRNLTWNARNQSGYLPTDCNGDDLTDGTDYGYVLDNRLRVSQRP